MKVFLALITSVVVTIISAIIFGTIVMLVWNWIVPDIFGLTKITLLQAWGLTLLIRLLLDGKISINFKG